MLTPAPRHALLLSGDIKFLDVIERALREAWRETVILRLHPEGDLSSARSVLGADAPRTIAIVDHRRALRPELVSALEKLGTQGGRAVAVATTPRHPKDLNAPVEPGLDLLWHNVGWDSPRIAQTIVTVHSTQGLSAMDFGGGKSPAVTLGEGTLSDPKEKGRFLEDLAGRLGVAHVQRTRRGRIASVVDELLMNAIYHAPKGSGEIRPAQIRWQIDAGVFHASVTDAFGSFTAKDALQKLVTFLANDMVEITRTGGLGGGVGLFLVLRSSTAYHLYVEPGRRTESSVCIDLNARVGTPRTFRAKREILFYFARKN
jgi:anti-sigma regulatory factor (Ser/Thr protein kinase)